MDARKILIYLSHIHQGNWDKIYEDITNRNIDFSDEEIDKVVSSLKCRALTLADPDYPLYLHQVFKPPFVIYYYGDISLLYTDEKSIAVVGSRNCSDYGKNITQQIVSDLAKDYTIVSGLAKGIDSIAHLAAINAGGKTIAVLGSGINICYPFENLDLYNLIKKDHLLISEYPPDTPITPDKFPFRNRLIAHLSRAVVVPEAKYMSGTSITVSFALNKGIDVMCVPHNAGEQSLCNQLINEGASLVESASDVRIELVSPRRYQKYFSNH